MKTKEILFLIAAFFYFCFAYGATDVKEVVLVQNSASPKSEREAILILPGLGDTGKGRKHQQKFFSNKGYDVFIPDYQDKKSYQGTIEKLKMFWSEQGLGEYEKVHVFSYILGSWVLNEFIIRENPDNIASIVYDRSPIQEMAPEIVTEKIPGLARMVSGQLIFDFAEAKYPTIINPKINIGIMVESKATKLMKMFKKTAKSRGPIDWLHLDFNQPCDDMIYVSQNHDEMYVSFDEIGGDILHFFENGKFKEESRRYWFGWNPYQREE